MQKLMHRWASQNALKQQLCSYEPKPRLFLWRWPNACFFFALHNLIWQNAAANPSLAGSSKPSHVQVNGVVHAHARWHHLAPQPHLWGHLFAARLPNGSHRRQDVHGPANESPLNVWSMGILDVMLHKVLNLPWIDPIRRWQQPSVGFHTLARRRHPGFEADQGLVPIRASFQVGSQLNDHCFQRHLLAVDAICRRLRSPEKDRLPIVAAAHQQVAQGWIPVAKDEDIFLGLQSLHLPWWHMFEVLVSDRARHHSLAQLQVVLEALGSNDHHAPNILGSSSHGSARW